MSIRTVALFLLLVIVRSQELYAQDFVPLFDGKTLRGWKTEHTKAEVSAGALRIRDGNGWVRTQATFSDFTLKLDFRLSDNARAGIFLRAWPTFDKASNPNNGYRLTLATGGSALGNWHHLAIDCVGFTATVRLDDSIVYSADRPENPQGYVALWANRGAAEFRAIEIKDLSSRNVPTFAGAFKVENEVQSPQLRSQVRPAYTADAMAAKIQGIVVVTAIVLPDGTVGDAVVTRSLDPKYGLDKEALIAAKAWRFRPGTRFGQPVAVQISIELTFTLR